MNRFHRHALLALALCSTVATLANAAGQAMLVNGVEIYYSIALVSAAAKSNISHGASGYGMKLFHAGSHHLVVSLTEAKTGARINDATVIATVVPLGLVPTSKPLQPMEINNTITYGNFFVFSPSSGPFRISLNITRSSGGAQESVIAEFQYQPTGTSGR